MYEDGEKEIAAILKLVEGCPENLKHRAFEILLQGYVDSVVRPPTALPPPAASTPPAAHAAPSARDDDWSKSIPAETLQRLRQIARRNKVEPEKIAALFDFSTDPVSFATFHIPGKNNAERARRAALVVAARAYLSTAKWSADWREVKSVCTHQNCYDGNFSTALTKGKGSVFKIAKVGDAIELSNDGVTEAEKLIAQIAAGDDAAA